MDRVTLHAYGAISEVLALRVATCWMNVSSYHPRTLVDGELVFAPSEERVAGPIFHHGSMSDWEECAQCLWSLKVLKALDPTPDGKWAYHFKLDCSPSQVAAIARENAATGPTFERLLGTFIACLYDYGAWIEEQSEKAALIIDKRAMPAIHALENLGFISRSGSEYRWTDKIRPVMQKQFLWL